ncbi:MAG: sodium-dependent transporter [Bacteroidales bacterium]|nr:sodium-dependent transporter [Bacteroidales bacterium]
MANIDFSKRGSFGSKFGVIAAAAGSAIGLGNIWRFPYITGENGGAAFIFIYLIFIVVIGMPVMLSEFIIGRRAQRNPYGAFQLLAPGKPWFLVGLMGVLAAFLILAFYGTVAGWTLDYLYESIRNTFHDKNPGELNTIFHSFISDPYKPVFWQVVFMILTAGIVIAGVEKGIEKYTKILMPLLLVIIVVLCIRAVTLPGARDGVTFLFKPDFSKITGNTILVALGQAFFSLSIGMGALITYGSYISKKDNLESSAAIVCSADTLIAVIAGIAIFPAVFAFGIKPDSGPDLVFKTLPNIFQQMPGGYYFSIIFFVLLTVAALTSSISLLEVAVAFFVEHTKMSRLVSAILAAFIITLLGVFCTLSYGVTSDFSILGKNVFDLFDFTTANIFLPLGGFFIVLFVGWFLPLNQVYSELSNDGAIKASLFWVFMVIVRFIAPIAIAVVFLSGINVIKV